MGIAEVIALFVLSAAIGLALFFLAIVIALMVMGSVLSAFHDYLR